MKVKKRIDGMNRRQIPKQYRCRIRYKNSRSVTVMMALLAVILISGCFLYANFLSSAHDSNREAPMKKFKYYKSIVIQPGDTLWNLADEYITVDYGSVTEYIDDLKNMNHLNSDDIQAGQYLIVAYYDTEFPE